MSVVLLALLLQAQTQAQPVPQVPAPISVQLAVRIDPDTVTVGERFIAVLRVRAPAGATIEFPAAPDSASIPPTATRIIGEPLIRDEPARGATIRTAAYRMTAWDVGQQSLGLANIVVRADGQVGYVSLSSYRVFVRSVLPADSALRVPKPPRAQILVKPISEIPWLLFFAALLLAALGRWLWQVYRRWRARPLEPFAAAEREFARIEALNLVAAGDGPRHVAMMVDTMRVYLARRVTGIELSHTSSELIAAAGSIQSVTPGLGALLWRADLAKFAAHRTSGEDATETGRSSREVVLAVEAELERREAEAKRSASKRAA